MGQHIVPQHLLRRISPDGRTIWQYDKKAATVVPKRLPITQVSQTPKFFDDDIEKLLSTIESVGIPILDKLAQGQRISSIEKRIMAVYLEMYHVRNREQRERWKGEFLGDRDKIERFMDDGMKHMRGTNLHAKYTNQKTDLIERYESDPDQVFRDAWVPSNLIRCLFFHMTWRVAESDAVDFVVGEPPLAYAGAGALGHPDAEIFFPLSRRQVLHMSWLGDPAIIERVPMPRAAAHQANKIFISTSARFIFFDKNCSKMAKLVKKKKFHNNRIKLNWHISGVNPYRPEEPLRLSDGDIGKLLGQICMHPAASEFGHAWREAESLRVVDDGGKVVEKCEHCGALKLKYEASVEVEVRNSEVDLAIGRSGSQQNWWTEWEVTRDR